MYLFVDLEVRVLLCQSESNGDRSKLHCHIFDDYESVSIPGLRSSSEDREVYWDSLDVQRVQKYSIVLNSAFKIHAIAVHNMINARHRSCPYPERQNCYPWS